MLYKNGSKNANTAYIVHCIECNSIKHFHDTRNDFFFCIEHIDVTFPGIKNTRETIQCTCALWLSTQSGLGCIIQTCLTLRPYGSTVKHEMGPRNFRCLPSCQVHGPNIFFQEKHLPAIMSRLVEF